MYRYVKCVLDMIAALGLGMVTALLCVFIVPAIMLSSPGPILFRQKRLGKDGAVFMIYKFRTMRPAREGEGGSAHDMQRLTRVGAFLRKLSLDELPQIINILRGEMSFIGPRPLLTEYAQRYNAFQRRRHEVLPGITGWAQVNGRNSISWEDKFKYDIWYVDHISFMLDMKIALMTIMRVFARRDVNHSEGVTMGEFMGTDKTNE